jgi:hypothetical protein
VGVAVNVTDVPLQMVVCEAEIETEGVTLGFTVMLMVLLLAVAGEAQVVLEVMVTCTFAPFVKLLDVKVGELVPAAEPFTVHA